jgi:hypothetical protein
MHIQLLSADGRPLDVSPGDQAKTNPAESLRPDLAEDAGTVLIGFAWTGSYCGAAAAAVTLPVFPGALQIPLTGSSPSCQKASNSRMIPGSIDYPGRPVEPAPAAWSALRARLVVPKVVQPGAIPVSVVLDNSGAQSVSLAAPCPTYETDVMIPLVPQGNYGGNEEETGGGGDVCGAAVVVDGHASLTLKLAPVQISLDPRNKWVKGGTVSVSWAMAGVPTAHATAQIG